MQEKLTEREEQVLYWLCRGCTNKQIGEILGISRRTVDTYRSNLMGKLRVNDRWGLTEYAKERGIFTNIEQEGNGYIVRVGDFKMIISIVFVRDENVNSNAGREPGYPAATLQVVEYSHARRDNSNGPRNNRSGD